MEEPFITTAERRKIEDNLTEEVFLLFLTRKLHPWDALLVANMPPNLQAEFARKLMENFNATGNERHSRVEVVRSRIVQVSNGSRGGSFRK